jgi:hypothetical protein
MNCAFDLNVSKKHPKVCNLIIHNATIGYMYSLFVFYFIVHFTSEGVYYEG